tara:strand:+ start:7538 stop:7909 length:372 start_codon:yes stop_codon:yes gene_type:complete
VFWKLLPVVPILTFSHSTIGFLSSDFGSAGLPDAVLPLHAWVNAFESAGWLSVLALSFTGRSWVASRLAVFLAGMWFWDMVTTLNLEMPVPPLQIIWGPVSVFAMLLLAYQLHLDSKNILKDL